VTTRAGVDVSIVARVVQAPETRAGVTLVLQGSGALLGGPEGDLRAVTDARGVATFTLRTTAIGTHPLTVVALGQGGASARVVLEVEPGTAANIEIRPTRLELPREAAGRAQIRVEISDQHGNPIPGRSVELRPEVPDMGLGPMTATTGADGVAVFELDAGQIQRIGRLSVHVGPDQVGSVAVLFGAGPPSAEWTRFVAGTDQVGPVSTELPEDVVLEVRDAFGVPIAGQPVEFRAGNGVVEPETAVSDTAGRVALRVRLGEDAGRATIRAIVGPISVETAITVTAAPAVGLILARSGRPVAGTFDVREGERIELQVRAVDRFGNAVRLEGLEASVGDGDVLQVVGTDAGQTEGRVVLQAGDEGSTGLSITASGVSQRLVANIMTGGARPWSVGARFSLVGFDYDWDGRPNVSGESGVAVDLQARRAIGPIFAVRGGLTLGNLGADTVGASLNVALAQGWIAGEAAYPISERVSPVAFLGFGRYRIQSDETGAVIRHTNFFWMIGAGLDFAVTEQLTGELRIATQQLRESGIGTIASMLPVGVGLRVEF
jgi:opacity protein-like surface antigen